MDRQEQKRYFNLCNPDEPLEPGDPRNLDIDAQGPEADPARGVNWVATLARDIELSDAPVCKFFTGLPGSGKSTELRRLARRLEQKGGANLLPVLVDAEEVLDIFNPIDVPDILVAVIHMTEAAVLEAEGKTREQALEVALRDGYLARFWHWLRETDVSVPEVEARVGRDGLEASALLEMKTSPSFRTKIRERVATHMTSFRREVTEHVKGLNDRSKRLGRSGLLVILDSLEKLRGISTNWLQVLGSAERIFAGEAPYLRLPVHVVYTIPPALVLRLKMPVHFMPMLRLHDRKTGARSVGFTTARDLVGKRLPDEVLKEVFGPLFEQRTAELIEWSGGYPREIVRLLQTAVAQAPLSEPLFRRLLGQAGDNYRRTVPESAIAWLAKVALDRPSALVRDDAHRETADLMLSNSVVLRYQNDEEWFDVHPALRGSPLLEAAMKSLEAERKRSVG